MTRRPTRTTRCASSSSLPFFFLAFPFPLPLFSLFSRGSCRTAVVTTQLTIFLLNSLLYFPSSLSPLVTPVTQPMTRRKRFAAYDEDDVSGREEVEEVEEEEERESVALKMQMDPVRRVPQRRQKGSEFSTLQLPYATECGICGATNTSKWRESKVKPGIRLCQSCFTREVRYV